MIGQAEQTIAPSLRRQNILVHTQGLTKTYPAGAAPVVALCEVDLDVEIGELLVIMGSSGSGKSTLLYLLSGLERTTHGEIHFGDRRIDTMNETELALLRRTGIGFVFQAIHLIPHLTLLENVVLPGYLVSADRAAVDRQAIQLLTTLGIKDLAGRLPAQVSGGEQQRAAVARAMINSPRALLADEPTGALNSSAGAAVLESLRTINALGQTIIMATHEVKSACIADRILFLRDGEVRAEYRMKDTVLPAEEREAAVLAWLVERGW
jgi:putative ABC transport system ATP-binding protein